VKGDGGGWKDRGWNLEGGNEGNFLFSIFYFLFAIWDWASGTRPTIEDFMADIVI